MASRFRWCYDDFCEFYESLTLPDGQPARLEGFQRLILREILHNAEGRKWTAAGARREDRRETLIVVPKGHAKTCLMAALGVFHLLVVPNAQVFAGAADLVQADEWRRTASWFVDSEPELSARAKVLGGTKEIRSLTDQGFIKILASDDSKQKGRREGFNPTAAFIDELHAHENDALVQSLQGGLFKRNGFIATITTAGWDLEGVLGVARQSYLDTGTIERFQQATDDGEYVPDPDGRLSVVRKASGQSVMLEWALTADDDPDDFETVKKCNPASWVSLDSLRYAKESLSPWAFRRLRCNIWTLAFESWLPVGAWEDLYEPDLALSTELPIWASLDMARYSDSAALVAVQPRDGKPIAVKAWIWKPGGRDDPVSYDVVKDAIRALHRDYQLVACGYDSRLFEQAGEELAVEGIPMELVAQSNQRMGSAAAGLRRAILEKRLAHDGDPVLAAHVVAPIAKEIGADVFKLDKERRNGPDIDAAEALSFALELCELDEGGEALGAWG